MISKEILEQARRLEIYTRRKVNENFAGQYQSAFKGRGMEFAEIRQYLPGDDIRSIDWNVTARMGEPFVKKYVEERELTLLLAVDGSASSLFGSGPKTKRQVAAEFSAVLALTAIRQQDKVGLIIFTDHVEHYIPPAKGRRHCLKIISELLHFQPSSNKTNIATALDTAVKILNKRAIIFLVSDFLTCDYEGSIKLVNQRHDVIGVSVTDSRERELPKVGLLELQDWETGETMLVDTSSKDVRSCYKKAMEQRIDLLRDGFRRMGVDHIAIETERSFLSALLRFFQNRGQRR
jgi:uncharacterized protein (DUF58 family)